MKKGSILVAGIMLCFLLGFTSSQYVLKRNTAEVNQRAGFYLFVDSEPMADYEYLGTVKVSLGFDEFDVQYSNVRDRLIKKARKKYPEANGLILTFTTGGEDKADCIRFK